MNNKKIIETLNHLEPSFPIDNRDELILFLSQWERNIKRYIVFGKLYSEHMVNSDHHYSPMYFNYFKYAKDLFGMDAVSKLSKVGVYCDFNNPTNSYCQTDENFYNDLGKFVIDSYENNKIDSKMLVDYFREKLPKTIPLIQIVLLSKSIVNHIVNKEITFNEN